MVPEASPGRKHKYFPGYDYLNNGSYDPLKDCKTLADLHGS